MALISLALERYLGITGERPLTSLIAAYLSLMKPNILAACLLAAAGGFLSFSGTASTALFVFCLAGTGLTVGSASALNMVLERNRDGMMRRTSTRPIPSGRVSPAAGLCFAILCGLSGIGLLALAVNTLTALLALAALLIYAFVYTPLKGVTPFAFLAGLLPGAMPALMGWTAGAGSIDLPGLSLFCILILWQIPHTLAVSLCFEQDYAGGGIRSFAGSFGVRASIRLIQVTTALLPLVTLLPVFLNQAGLPYLFASLTLGFFLAAYAVCGIHRKEKTSWARRYFIGSQIYIAALILAFILDTFF